jgi:hypothetical protein
MLRSVALLLLLINTLFAQHRVSPEMMYHRVCLEAAPGLR